MKLFNVSGIGKFVCDCKKGKLVGYHFNYPNSLPEEEKERIFDMLYPVALSAFAQDPSDEIADDVRNHIFSVGGLLVVTDVDEQGSEFVVAFRMWDNISYSILEGDILYLAGMCVKEDYQGYGIGRVLLDYVLFKDSQHKMHSIDQVCPLLECKYVALRTQNPIMKRCFDEATGEMSYPKSGDELIPDHIKDVGAQVAKHLKDFAFNSDTLTSRGLYGRSLYGRNPQVQDSRYKSLFAGINQDKGDAMVCVWQRRE